MTSRIDSTALRMCPDPSACCAVAALICLTIPCSFSTARVMFSLPFACWFVAAAISFPMLEAVVADSRMFVSAFPASCESATPSSTSRVPDVIDVSALRTSCCTD